MMMIVPAILGHTKEEIQQQFNAVSGLSPLISYDIADNKFVNSNTPLPRDFPEPLSGQKIIWHLMVKAPDDYITQCMNFASESIIIHAEAANINRTLQLLSNTEILSGLALNPTTPVTTILPLLEKVDLVQIMTVEPGEQGREFIFSALEKIPTLRKLKENLVIAVDGGVNADTIKEVIKYQPDYIMVGSFLTQLVGAEENFALLGKAVKQ